MMLLVHPHAHLPHDDHLPSLDWLLRQQSSAAAGAGPAALEPSDEKGRRSRRHLGKRHRDSPYAAAAAAARGRRGVGRPPAYWSSHGETGVTDEGEELDAGRPPFSFTCLIGLAILKSGSSHISVGDIYKYMVRNFPYFKTAKQTWRNSVRHVLSLGKYFCKRRKGSTVHDELGPCVGKGAVWSIKGAMLPSLLQHIEHGARQLAPAVARHLGLAGLGSAVAAAAAAAAPALPTLAPLPGGPAPLDLGLDQLDDPMLGALNGGSPTPPSPDGSDAGSCGWSSSSSDSGLEVEMLPLGLPDAPGPDDWLDRTIDLGLLSDISQLLGEPPAVVPQQSELPTIDAWFAATTSTALPAF